MLAASLPESVAWLIGRWIGLWSCICGRANRQEVRERIHEIEGCFWDRYESEHRDSSDATRATLRALWLVRWEVLKAPKTAASAAAAVAAEHSRRNPDMQFLPGHMQLAVQVAKKKVTVGPIAFLLIVSPGIAHGALSVLGVADMSVESAMSVALLSISMMLTFRRQDSFTSKLSKSFPIVSALFSLYYVAIWASFIALSASAMPPYASGLMAGAASLAIGGMCPLIVKLFWDLMKVERTRILVDYLLSKASDVDGRKDLLVMQEDLKKYP